MLDLNDDILDSLKKSVFNFLLGNKKCLEWAGGKICDQIALIILLCYCYFNWRMEIFMLYVWVWGVGVRMKMMLTLETISLKITFVF